MEVIVDPIDELASIERLWARLDRIGGHSFFCTWNWIGTWLSLLPSELKPNLLKIVRGEEVVGAAVLVAAPSKRGLVEKSRHLHFNATGNRSFDCITIEHNGFAGEISGNAEVWKHLAGWFAKQGNFSGLCIPGVSEKWLLDRSNNGILHSRRNVEAFRVCGLQLLKPDGGIEERLGRNSRQQLRRSLRAYGAHGQLCVEEAKDVASALNYFSALKEYHIHSWQRRGKAHAFSFPFFETFHRDLIARGVTSGAVQLLRISAGEHIIGYLYNFRQENHIYAYQSGFNYDEVRLKPGYVCHVLAIRHNAKEGIDTYDFLAGSNQMKKSLSNDSYDICWHKLKHRNIETRLEAAIRSGLGFVRGVKVSR